jgi:hypothetical protein
MRVGIGCARGVRLGSLEGGAAAATTDGIGVLDAKTGPAEAIGEIDGGTAEVFGAFFVDEDLDALPLDDGIAVLALIKGHAVLKTGATPMLDKNAQASSRASTCALIRGIGFVRKDGLKLFDCAVRNGDHECFTLSEGMIEVKRGVGIRNSKFEIRILRRLKRLLIAFPFHFFEFRISNFEFNRLEAP